MPALIITVPAPLISQKTTQSSPVVNIKPQRDEITHRRTKCFDLYKKLKRDINCFFPRRSDYYSTSITKRVWRWNALSTTQHKRCVLVKITDFWLALFVVLDCLSITERRALFTKKLSGIHHRFNAIDELIYRRQNFFDHSRGSIMALIYFRGFISFTLEALFFLSSRASI